jgi:hypothetical protein
LAQSRGKQQAMAAPVAVAKKIEPKATLKPQGGGSAKSLKKTMSFRKQPEIDQDEFSFSIHSGVNILELSASSSIERSKWMLAINTNLSYLAKASKGYVWPQGIQRDGKMTVNLQRDHRQTCCACTPTNNCLVPPQIY